MSISLLLGPRRLLLGMALISFARKERRKPMDTGQIAALISRVEGAPGGTRIAEPAARSARTGSRQPTLPAV